ncbi:MAG: hypothetical protein HQM14_12760 [SAR324 cluster bacterium]|nr:hypothetical protein [SAR324 cluster bacterium]
MKNTIQTITREAIQASTKRFLSEGKKITVLPPQQETSHSYIGGEKWNSYESLLDL